MSRFRCVDTLDRPIVVEAERLPAPLRAWDVSSPFVARGLWTADQVRAVRARLHPASVNLGLGAMPAMRVVTPVLTFAVDLGLLIAAWHPHLLADEPEVVGELGLDGALRPVRVSAERLAVPSGVRGLGWALPWQEAPREGFPAGDAPVGERPIRNRDVAGSTPAAGSASTSGGRS